MAIDKRTSDHALSARVRSFYVCDRTKPTATKHIPSILKRRNRLRYSKPYPLTLVTSRVNIVDRSPLPSSRSFPDRTLKIILPMQRSPRGLQDNTGASVPSSFAPPPPSSPTSDTKHPHTVVEDYDDDVPPRNNVRFYNKVQVLRIPSRDQYPESMRRSMWASLSEITENARRNTIEFSSEGWDWRVAAEEKDMYIHPSTGERIHPVHVKRARAMAATQGARQKQHEVGTEQNPAVSKQQQTLVNAQAA